MNRLARLNAARVSKYNCLMNNYRLEIEIRPAKVEELDKLQAAFSPGNLAIWQQKRYEVQAKGEGVYLIAWHNDVPVGHFLLSWSGPHDEHVTRYVDIRRSAFMEAGLTKDEYRRKGVATTIIKEAEKLAREHGCKTIGLEVGSADNPAAKRLYKKLGYKDWMRGAFVISWEYVDKDGIRSTPTETVIYMYKPLGQITPDI